MQHEELVELARICAKNSYLAHSKEASAELWKMATEYSEKAAKLDGGKAPDIGKPPVWLTDSAPSG